MGKVYLIGAGPGDPGLLTVKGARILARAEVVLHDALVSREILETVSPSAEVIDVGKRCGKKLLTQEEINALLVDYAQAHEIVVRLKGGDPAVFGRAAEETESLRDANIEFEIVPGITSALGAAAAAGISLTDRRVASQVLFATFSRGVGGSAFDWGGISSATTLALYMPGPDYAEVAHRLREAGLPGELPCVIVSSASTPKQRIRWTSVGKLGAEERLPAPALMIVGRVARRQIREISSAYWDKATSENDLRITSIS